MTQRNRQTRNQRKREAVKTAVVAVMLFVLCAAITVWALGVWTAHPGEQPVSGRAYMASMQIGGDRCGDD